MGESKLSFRNYQVNNLSLSRDACGVEVDDTFIITGGQDDSGPNKALNSVVRYNSRGVSEVLPSLTVRRINHACASYLNGNGQKVSWYYCECIRYIYDNF